MTVGKHEATVVIKGESTGASKAVDDLSKRLEKLEKKLTKTTKSSEQFSSAWNQKTISGATKSTGNLLNSVTALRAGFAGMAVGGAVVAANKIRELAAESLKLQNVFGNLPFSLDKARSATMGLVDDAQLATAAVTAQRFGVAKNAEEFAKLAEAATKLSITTGQDAAKGISDLTTALSRQSPMILDNLGISLKLSEAHERYAQRLGKSTKELTENEKAEAFRVEAMAAAQEATKGLAVETDGLAASLAKAEVSAKNLTTALLGGGGGPAAMQPWEAMEKVAQEAAEAAAEFDDLNQAARDGSADQQRAVQAFLELRSAMADSANHGASLAKTNKLLANSGVEIALNAEQASGEFLTALNRKIKELETQEKLTGSQREALEAQRNEAIFAKEALEFAEENVSNNAFELKLARAQGLSELEILKIQQMQIEEQRELIVAKADVGAMTAAQAAAENGKLDEQKQILDALIAKTRTRGRVGRRASKDIVKGLIEEAKIGEEAAQSREVRAEFDRFLFDEETAHARARLEQNEALQLQRERELDFITGDGLAATQQRINKENELLTLQIEAARLAEEMAFTEEEQQTAADAREQLLHEQKVKRMRDEMDIRAAMDADAERSRQDQLARSTALLGIQKDFIQGFGKVAVEGAKQRGASERAVFNAEKGIKSASLALDAITYGAKASAACAAQNYIQGAGFTVAAGIATAAAIQTLAMTPDAARGEAGAGGGASAAPSQAPDRGGTDAPSSQIPGSATDGRGATLPNGAGPKATGGGVSVNIGTFQTLGTVDDETGTKLAQAIERVKADGLA